jgi:hypothetical protein
MVRLDVVEWGMIRQGMGSLEVRVRSDGAMYGPVW